MGEGSSLARKHFSRRRFLRTAAAAGAIAVTAGSALLGSKRASAAGVSRPGNHHLAWVWQFSDDGSMEEVRAQMAFIGGGIILKTHDGIEWMSRYDKAPTAVSGGAKVREIRDFMEYGGVPFHAWAVVKGLDPIREAQMAAEVLANGARSIVFDLEPSDGGSFWEGTQESALAFGAELRRLQPNAFLSVAPDPRPWQVDAVPMREFATFVNEIAPQSYWPLFSNSATNRLLVQHGFEPPNGPMTPEYVLDMNARVFADYGLPVKPVGSGSQGGDAWERFVTHAQELGMAAVSVWRYGTAKTAAWDALNAHKPLPNAYYGPDWMQIPAPPPPASTPNDPKGLAALPEVAQPDSVRTKVLRSQEATTPAQGVSTDLDQRTNTLNPFDIRNLQQRQKKSFWANPTIGSAR